MKLVSTGKTRFKLVAPAALTVLVIASCHVNAEKSIKSSSNHRETILDLSGINRGDQLLMNIQNSQSIIKNPQIEPFNQIPKPSSELGSSKQEKAEQQDQLQASPSVTSVHHQVWTSSSGSLNELSPEVISKLRSDVPFLAAYALRPRLVGVASLKPETELAGLNRGKSDLLAQQSSSKQSSAPSAKQQDLIPRLGDFSEFNIETSSLSKSEHHHKRKTSLKRDNELRRRIALEAGELRRARGGSARKANGQSSSQLQNKRIRAKKFNKKAEEFLSSQVRTGKLRRRINQRNLAHHMSIIKYGRLFQDDNSIKGGSKGVNKNKEPFYTRKEGTARKAMDEYDDNKANGAAETGAYDGEEDSGEAQDEAPKRVGDGDVEEGGDTVTVMPKSDGVDDDPEIDDGGPIEDNESSSGDETNPRKAGEREVAQPEVERDKRVGREKPTNENDQNDSRGNDSALGGGIGATTGGDSGSSGGASDHESTGASRDGAGDSGSSARDNKQDSNDTDTKNRAGSGGSSVEFANGNDRDEGNDDDAYDIERKIPADRRQPVAGENDGKGRNNEGDDGLDVDYRDEAARDLDRKKGKDMHAGEHKPGGKQHEKDCEDGSYDHHGEHHHHDTIKWLQDAIPGEPKVDYPILSRINATNFNCRDQKYPGFYADVELRCQVFHICQSDGRQDSFLCPNGTIFSQTSTVCVWWNSFDCEDAPKYYDLNGLLYKTTTTNLANNGAIPRSSSSDSKTIKPRDELDNNSADDSSSSAQSIDELIRSMRRMRNGNGGDAMSSLDADQERHRTNDLDDVAGDGRRLKPTSRMNGGDNIGDVDEATIQRKQPADDVDENDAVSSRNGSADDDNDQSSLTKDGTSASRLRASSRSLHSRQRRASTRQAPPKLKSRRVSRYSRRRKLRHGVKPKRRA